MLRRYPLKSSLVALFDLHIWFIKTKIIISELGALFVFRDCQSLIDNTV